MNRQPFTVYRFDELLSAVLEVERAAASENEEIVAGLLARYEARRHSMPVFMRELKQRFTRWFNRRHSRKGTLWEDRYRLLLFEAGVEIRPDAQSGSRGRRGFCPERVEAERRRGGRLPLAKALRCKLRHFTDAAVMGSEAYVKSVFAAFPERFGPKRKSGARKAARRRGGGPALPPRLAGGSVANWASSTV